MTNSNNIISKKIQIHCYKHNGKLHRMWDNTLIIDEKEDYIVCANNRVDVLESDGKSYKTTEPAIIFFYKKYWFNIIAQFKNTGLFYYCNIASPYLIDNNTIKYIDYDLDLRVFPNGSYKILDRNEYNYHKKTMHYSNELNLILNKELKALIEMYNNKENAFNKNIIENYYKIYKNLAN